MNKQDRALVFAVADTVVFMSTGAVIYALIETRHPVGILVAFGLGAMAAVVTLLKATIYEDAL